MNIKRRDFMWSMGLSSAAALAGCKRKPAWSAGALSRVFQVDHVDGVRPDESFGGLEGLLSLMASHDYRFYQSPTPGPLQGPSGLIGREDVVMLKVNSQWDDRGMTNVDLVRGLVKRIADHPDGFVGEIVFVDNVQFKSVTDCFGWQSLTHSEDRTQNYRHIIDDYSGAGHKVSGYDWRTSNWRTGGLPVVETADDHISDDYYHDPTGESAHYPRFTTEYGTRINFNKGIWTGSGYDNARLKLINLPMLKDHQYKTMITACLKNYMGVIAPSYGGPWGIDYDYHFRFEYLVGKMVGTTRVPDLNILDATWVIKIDGPEGYSTNAVEVGTLMASVDPVAIDYHAAKHVLYPISGNDRHNPDLSNTLRTCLTSAMNDLRTLGYDVMASLNDSSYTLLGGGTSSVPHWRLF